LGAFLSVLAGCGAEGGIAGQWYIYMTKVESCDPRGPKEYRTPMHVWPVEANEQEVWIVFGNQEWQAAVGPDGSFAEKQVVSFLSGQFDGDTVSGELTFIGPGCKNHYTFRGTKVLDYP
jgi:hypothetical protein